MAWQDISQVGFLAILAILSVLVYRRSLTTSQSAPINTPLEVTSVGNGKTYCVRGVPIEWHNDQLQTFLARYDGCRDPVIKSLALETHGRSKTATVIFRDRTQPPKALRGSLQPGDDHQTLILDDSFLGLTALFAPSPEDHQVDIVAISGLGGHAFGSFKEREGQHMWLRDALPYHLLWEHTNRPMARVMTYGYESAVAQSSSMQNLEDLATSFRESLNVLTSSRRARPLILVAHSLGGLIVKQALITLANSTEEDHQKIIRAVYGIVFFGVPHDGMDISSLIPMVGDGPNRELVGSLSRINSQILSQQQRAFHGALGHKGYTEVFCFYETLESPTARQDESGKWHMNGPKAVLVTKSSATHCRPWEDGPENVCAINRSHSNMVKFGQEDHEYERALQRLRGLAKRALGAQIRLRDKTTKFLVPYNQNPSYVGRSTILDTVKERLGYSKSQATRQPRVSLFGLGGVGKTQIALAFIYWIKDNYSDVSVFWVHASNAERFYQAFTSIAEEYSIPGRDDPQSDVLMLTRKWLEQKERGRWVMIIDNADDTELFFPSNQERVDPPRAYEAKTADRVARYIPECSHGSILITTRSKQTGLRLAQEKPPIEVSRMDVDEADQLLRAALGGETVTFRETSNLASHLDYLPLALSQAASFIHANSISIDRYIRLLDESDSNLVSLLSEPLEATGNGSETPHAIAATWIISFEQIDRRHRFASEVLSLLSLFDRQAIPETFVADYYRANRPEEPGSSESMEVVKALGILKAFSFITEAEDQTIDMHRLVQLVTRKWLVNKSLIAKLASEALKIVSHNYPYGRYETRDICTKYLPHAKAVLKNDAVSSEDESLARASVLHCVGAYFSYQGQWNDCEQYQLQAVDLRKTMLGDEHLDTLSSMGNLAVTYWNQGRWKEAEELLVQVMETSSRVLGDKHPDTLISMGNLAATYWNQGRWKEAEELLVQVIEMRKRVLGDEHPSTLSSMGNLAATYRNQGQWKKAEELEVQVMEMSSTVLGDEHPLTLSSMGNLAATYWNQGRWKEAEELEVQVMETSSRVLGDEHPSTLSSIGSLAATYRNQGRWKEAEELFVQVIETSSSVLGDKHPNMLTSMANLASIYRNQGRWKEAEELEVQVIEMRKRVLGDEHPLILSSMGNLAATYRNQGQWKEAEELEVQVMETSSRVLGDEHPSTLSSMGNLAATYWNQGRWKEAEELEVQVMETRKRALGDEHPDTLISMANLASTWKSQGRRVEAIQLIRNCLQIQQRCIGVDHPATRSSLLNLEEWEQDL